MSTSLPTQNVVATYRFWNLAIRKWERREETGTVVLDPMAPAAARYVRVRFEDGREVNLPHESVREA